MLAVHRQQPDLIALSGAGDDFAGDHQHLFVGESDILAGLNRAQRRTQPQRANHRGYHQLRGRPRRDRNRAVQSRHDIDLMAAQQRP